MRAGIERRKADLARDADDLERLLAEMKRPADRITAGPQARGEPFSHDRAVGRVARLERAAAQNSDAVQLEELGTDLIAGGVDALRLRARCIGPPVTVVVGGASAGRQA